MRVIYRKIRHARYLYIKRNAEKVWGARYLSKNTVFVLSGFWEIEKSDFSFLTSICPSVRMEKLGSYCIDN
jgi:hypothetical protein